MSDIIKSRFSTLFCGALAAAGLGLTSLPVAAQTVDELTVIGRLGPQGEVRSLSQTVSYRDLDLRYPDARAELSRRINDTARGLCDRLGEGSSTYGPAPSCKEAAVKDAMAQARLAYASADARALSMAQAASDAAIPASDITAAAPPADTAVAASDYGAETATVVQSTVTNGPVADTPENRSLYGAPMSRAGRRTAPAGN